MHGPIGKTFEIFGLKQAYSKTIYKAINRRIEWDNAMENSGKSLSVGDRVYFKYGIGIISEYSLGKGENLIFVNCFMQKLTHPLYLYIA